MILVSNIAGVLSRLAGFGSWLIGLGAPGLFAICLFDSAFVPLPSGPDLAMIAMSTVNPRMMPLYALAATVGSTIGCSLLYGLARRGGVRMLKRVSSDKRDRIENLLGKHDILGVIVASLLPPPFPFKVFVLSAGVLKLKTSRFILAIFFGRLLRFLAEGFLAIEFGNGAASMIGHHGWKVLVPVAAIALIWLALRLRSRSVEEI